MSERKKVVIAGAGPVGMAAALKLAKAGLDVTVYELGEELSVDSKASTFHIPTLELCEELGVIDEMFEQGLKVPLFQQRDRKGGVIAELDLTLLKEETKYPYRLQLEQSKFTRIVKPHLEKYPNAHLVFGKRVASAEDHGDYAVAILDDGTRVECDWLVGCDGSNSMVRQSFGFEFPGETFAERFLVMSTTFEFRDAMTDLAEVAYITDPDEWMVLLKTPDHWRCLMAVSPDEDDDYAVSQERMQERLNGVLADVGYQHVDFPIIAKSLYRVNQRVAKNFAINRILLAGDSAHMNNPLGGFGMNSGIHDAWSAGDVIEAVELHGADAHKAAQVHGVVRSEVCHSYVQANTKKNFKDMQEKDEQARQARNAMLRGLQDDLDAQREYLRQTSMLTSAHDAIARVKRELAALTA
jgi:2-polyprenyl-6-methoxyphenol hydroxylase-like FAD-dependent oxidoreductase